MKTRVLSACLVLVALCSASAQVVINEYSCSNLDQFPDNYDKHEDWIEIYNTSSSPVSMAGYYLSDDEDEPKKWAFPTTLSIPGNSFYLVWASGRNEVTDDGAHASFKLTQSKNNPDHIVFTDQNGTELANIEVSKTQLDHSMGRQTDGGTQWRIMKNPTPGTSNNNTPSGIAYAGRPDVNIEGGFYQDSVFVVVSSTEPNATVRYTLNGNEPTNTSTIYTEPIKIDHTTVLKVRTFSNATTILPSFVQFNTYFINDTHNLPVISIGSNDVETLANGNQGLRPQGSVEYFDIDGDRKTRAYGELNSHGQDSWVNDQRSMDWVTRDEMGYNNALKKKIFSRSDRDSYQRVILRAAGDDNYPDASNTSGGAHIRDAYVHNLADRGKLNLDMRRGEKVIVYLNGKYWGIYDIRELPDDHDYTEYYYGQDKYDLEYILTWGNTWAEYGGDQALSDWNAFYSSVYNTDLTQAANYEHLTDNLDVTSLTDYVLTNAFTVCSDWLNYNTGWWRGTNPEGGHRKWGYILWDNDATFGHYINYTGIPDTTPYAEPCDVEGLTQPWPDVNGHMRLLNKMRLNPEFDQYYITRQADLANTVFSCENMLNYLDSIIAIIGPEIPRHTTRWGGSLQDWQQNANKLRNFISIRCNQVPEGIASCYNLTGPYQTVLRVEPAGAGTIQANTLQYDQFPVSTQFFGGVPLKLIAQPNEANGYIFEKWEAQNNTFSAPTSTLSFVDQVAPDTIVAKFKLASSPVQEPQTLSPEVTAFPTVFKNALSVAYNLPENATVRLELYTVLGQRVATLYDSGSSQVSGTHSLLFENAGKNLASGLYLLRFQADGFEKMVKLVKE
ncbi:MAG TPA: CotH kinase family protein [Saprospiraceae bacterium]|nr:CotH kinase family protein [Saprospiraceae bacterium]